MRNTGSCSKHMDCSGSILFALIISISLVACNSEPPIAEQSAKDLVRPVKLFTVGGVKSDGFLNYPAVIQSRQSSTLAFQVGGVLKEVLVIEAQQVEKGQVLAKLDQRDYLAQLNSIRAQFNNAETEYRRAERLITEQAISRSVLDQRKSQFEISRAQLDTAQKAIDDTLLLAPFSGNVATVAIEVSQNVQPGEAAISILGDGGLEAKINIPSYILAHAKESEEREGAAYLILDADQDIRIPARFKSVALEADPASQTFEVIFAFEAPKNLNVLPGMNATVWFLDPAQSNSASAAISVPLAAIATDNGDKFVWVVDQQAMTVAKRKVNIQSGIGSQLNVLSGLQEGETIVAAGVSYLAEGMKVRAWSN